MSRQTFVWSDTHKAIVPKEVVLRERAAAAARCRSDLPFPMIVSDQTEMRSMLDGRVYTSKRAYEASVRAAGHEIIGNEDISKHIAAPVACEGAGYERELASDVKTTLEKLEARVTPSDQI